MGSPMKSEHSLPEDFGNVVRLFPLPNVVLFPGIVQALQLFEPRYKALVADALETDQLITMALIDSQEQTQQKETLVLSCPVYEKSVTHSVCFAKGPFHHHLGFSSPPCSIGGRFRG